jgi:hypothetical protein
VKRTLTSLAIAGGVVALGVWSMDRTNAQALAPGSGTNPQADVRPLVAAARVAADAAVERIGEDARDVFDTRYSIVPADTLPGAPQPSPSPSVFARNVGMVPSDPNHVDLPGRGGSLGVAPSTAMKLLGIVQFGARSLASIDTGSGARPYGVGDVVGLTKVVAIGRDSVTLADGTILTMRLAPTVEDLATPPTGAPAGPTPSPFYPGQPGASTAPYDSTNGKLPGAYDGGSSPAGTSDYPGSTGPAAPGYGSSTTGAQPQPYEGLTPTTPSTGGYGSQPSTTLTPYGGR